MKLKLLQLVQSTDALSRLSQERMWGRLSRRTDKNMELIGQELARYNKARDALIQQYGTMESQTPQGTQYSFTKESGDKFNAEMIAMDADEVELDIYLLSDMDIDSIQITPDDLKILKWLREKEVVKEEVKPPAEAVKVKED